MTEEKAPGKTVKVHWAKAVGYKLGDDEVEIHCLLLEDGAVQWVFMRGGKEFRVSLSKIAMEAVFQLWQQALWEAPPLPKQPNDSEGDPK